MKLRFLLVVMLVMVGLCMGCRKGAPISTLDVAIGSVSDALSADEVRSAILLACADLGWTARELSPGVMQAKILVRNKHTVIVNIPYSPDHYAIQYVDSSNMEYKVKSDGTKIIHPNYNNWVNNLQRRIDIQIAQERAQKSK